ncbi:MAG: hypothetical protein COZ06_27390 [Armatimonadetes bacterium CG_4_10_14_3_um_filter_66_18]|nr:MAG: hypothetical protein COS65_31265 [Armatimonadetes bacterium CG06_land_8_20_14_3_00_66_21]PIY40961.1 MAG: hypothetical protein COZ06_27390 [Armatimonadetes bacterium CG_4_10_14_3_um_filter_66_18]PJB61959.1 MAG: hypothetical protein CO096_26870 [Armatimonadetes bacterium CG_4_9_14_3_um_filter_66_14]
MLAIKGLYDGTVVRPLEAVTAPANVTVVVVFTHEETKPAPNADVMQFAGCLKDCPAFQGDAVEMQRRWRDEWE